MIGLGNSVRVNWTKNVGPGRPSITGEMPFAKYRRGSIVAFRMTRWGFELSECTFRQQYSNNLQIHELSNPFDRDFNESKRF